jgi:hypothetical protein
VGRVIPSRWRTAVYDRVATARSRDEAGAESGSAAVRFLGWRTSVDMAGSHVVSRRRRHVHAPVGALPHRSRVAAAVDRHVRREGTLAGGPEADGFAEAPAGRAYRRPRDVVEAAGPR